MATVPTRVDWALFDAAKTVGETQSRSAAQQLDHWARIGRALEASPATTHEAIARVLAGQEPYDALGHVEQAVVRVVWEEQIADRAAALDLEEHLRAEGRPWAEADVDGNLVMRDPGRDA